MNASRLVLLMVVIFAVSAAAPAAAGIEIAQLTIPSPGPAPAVAGLDVEGIYETAPVFLDGMPVIRLGALVSSPASQLPIAVRVADVETAINELLAVDGTGRAAQTRYDPKTLRVDLKNQGDVAVLEAYDAKHPDPLPLVTVTSTDARAAGATSIAALGAQWQSDLQGAIVAALELRQPATEQRGFRDVIDAAIILVAASVAVYAALRMLWTRMEALEATVAQRTESTAAATTLDAAGAKQRRRTFALALRNLAPTERLRIYGAVTESLMWGLALAWLIAIPWGLSQFATTTPLAQTISRSAIGAATTIIVIGLLNRLLDIIIARAAAAWRLRRFGTSDDRARLLLRIPTIARAVSGAKTFLLVFIAALSVLGQIGVPIGSVVTIGGLAAVALSLAAQNFVRDFLNGFLVLFEDQYVVGDYVTINAYSGNVERLTLRMVQIRDAAGDLITIPHSSATSVVNGSRNWSRIDYRVAVDPAADVSAALGIMRTEIEKLVAGGDWTAGIAKPIEWIGVDAMNRDGVTLRAAIRTAPLRQFELARLINERVHDAFVQAGLKLGMPAAI